MRSPILYFVLLAVASASWTACGTSKNTPTDDAGSSTLSTAADQGMSSDWVSLFDGKTLNGWHAYGGGPVGRAWQVADDGSLTLDVSNKANWTDGDGGDIVTDESYDNYELELEWKISDCGNSGIIYNVTESENYPYPWLTGPEMQILDNTCHPDAKIRTHRAGDLYDMIEGDSTVVKPAGEWNLARLVNDNGQVTHYLNGTEMATYANSGDTWSEMIADSKFSDMEDFGKTQGGRIALQDHGDQVWFRNVRIREL